MLHGRFGEDGTVQGLLEMLDVAYVGAGVAASALCIDKVLFKELMAAAAAPQVGYVDVREEWLAGAARQGLIERVMRLGLPVFVKPAHLGSSVGIVRVAAEDELLGALGSAFDYDTRVIVEAAAAGVEVECAVLGATAAERAQGTAAIASMPGEIRFDGDFYDFEAKYTDGAMELRVPASISASATARVRELALEAFARTGCEGLARVDFFVDGEQVLLNELNTMPGFTPTSVYAKLIEASGIGYASSSIASAGWRRATRCVCGARLLRIAGGGVRHVLLCNRLSGLLAALGCSRTGSTVDGIRPLGRAVGSSYMQLGEPLGLVLPCSSRRS